MSTAPFLSYSQTGAIVVLTMNSPETRNALTGNSAPQEFVDACQRIDEDASVRCVVLTGAGTVFSSGGNLKHMQEMFDDTPAQLSNLTLPVARSAVPTFGPLVAKAPPVPLVA